MAARFMKSPKQIIDHIQAIVKRQNDQRVSVSDSFALFVTQIMPKYEQEIQTRILRVLYERMPNEQLKKHLMTTYKRRQLDLAYRAPLPELKTGLAPQPDTPQKVITNLMASNIEKVSVSDIGRFYDFGLENFEKYFPILHFGQLDYVETTLRRSLQFSIQMTPEAFSVIELLRAHKQLGKKVLNPEELERTFEACTSKLDLEILYRDRETFLHLALAIGRDLREALESRRFVPRVLSLFANSFYYDGIIMILLWQMYRSDVRKVLLNDSQRLKAMDSLVDQIIEHPESHYFVPEKMESWLELQKRIRIGDAEVLLEGVGDDFKRLPNVLRHYMLPSFTSLTSNILFWGSQGTGKSGVLYAVTMWAYKSGWLVIKLPSARGITHSTYEELVRHEKSRMHLTPKLASGILKDFVNSNGDLLSQIPVNLKIYGKYSMLGVHDDEPNPVPNIFIEDRQTYFYEPDKFRSKEDLEFIMEDQLVYDQRLTKLLKEPKTLADIANFGLANELFATNCIAEILEQAYQLDSHHVLVVVDDYNWLYRRSAHYSLYYDNIKSLEGTVPPYHISLCRMFMKFDGHRIKNGFKLAGTSNFTISKHYFEPEKINFPRSACHMLTGCNQRSLPFFYDFLNRFNLNNEDNNDWSHMLQVWMETQGNYSEMIRLLRFPAYRSI